MKSETWKDVVGYEGLYKVNSEGEVYSFRIDTYLTPHISHRGYSKVTLTKNKITKDLFIHRLVMIAFEGYKNGLDVNHKNGIKTDNRLENLEWCTRSENMKHAYNVLGITHNFIALAKKRSLKIVQLTMNGIEISRFPSQREAMRNTWINQSQICKACKYGITAGGFKWIYETL